MIQSTNSHLILETALGFVALAWDEQGLSRLALPEETRGRAERHAAKWRSVPHTADPPDFVVRAVELITRYAAGETVDFSTLPFSLDGIGQFDRDIYRAALTLAQGETTTYGELAEKSGHPGMARETGAALGRNPLPLLIPCHRITAANGKLGGFSAPGGAATKQRLLRHEGVEIEAGAPPQASFLF